jgi:hypothetical protein
MRNSVLAPHRRCRTLGCILLQTNSNVLGTLLSGVNLLIFVLENEVGRYWLGKYKKMGKRGI